MHRSLRTPLRISLSTFQEHHAAIALTLDISRGASDYTALFPHPIAVDVNRPLIIQISADAYALPYANEPLQIIVCAEVLQHVRKPRCPVAEIYHAVNPGGICFLSTRPCYHLYNWSNDCFRFTSSAFRELFHDSKAGLATILTYFHCWLIEKRELLWKFLRLSGHAIVIVYQRCFEFRVRRCSLWVAV
jgi:SAM-dependent methyltransferase